MVRWYQIVGTIRRHAKRIVACSDGMQGWYALPGTCKHSFPVLGSLPSCEGREQALVNSVGDFGCPCSWQSAFLLRGMDRLFCQGCLGHGNKESRSFAKANYQEAAM
eukprot:scaffold226481_cov17-Tisochrysis_lutea.AAC.1